MEPWQIVVARAAVVKTAYAIIKTRLSRSSNPLQEQTAASFVEEEDGIGQKVFLFLLSQAIRTLVLAAVAVALTAVVAYMVRSWF